MKRGIFSPLHLPRQGLSVPVQQGAQPARTHYQILRHWGPRTLVGLELDTGRTHQIRVHMAHIGCPLTGDFLYGTAEGAPIRRPALHSARLELDHPITGERLAFDLPLPDDMRKLMPNDANFPFLLEKNRL